MNKVELERWLSEMVDFRKKVYKETTRESVRRLADALVQEGEERLAKL